MASDAGGGLTRRRREICFLSRSFYNLSRNLFHFLLCYNLSLLQPSFQGDSMHLFNNSNGFPAKHFSLIRTVPWPATMVKEDYHIATCSLTVKSEKCLSNISRSMESRTLAILVFQWLYRIPSKSNMSSPCSSTEWSYVLTPEPLMILTAEGLDLMLPSSSQIDSSPYNGGCFLSFSPPAENLGFSLLGLSHCCGPFLLARPNFRNLNLSSNHKRPRFISFISSTSPSVKTCRSYALIDQSLCPCPKTYLCIWSCEFLSKTLLLITTVKAGETLTFAAEEDWKQVDSKKIFAQPHQSPITPRISIESDAKAVTTAFQSATARHCKPFSFVKRPSEAEALGIYEAMLSLHNINMEEPPKELQGLFNDIQWILNLLSSISISIAYVSRKENSIADVLASTVVRSMTIGSFAFTSNGVFVY